jgi:YfiH family protein
VTGIRHALLDAAGVEHAFGDRQSAGPADVVQPRQVHGTAVALGWRGRAEPAEADAIVSGDPDYPVGIVTADCVPVLACAADGRFVAAIHAGWRGLAAGVVERGVRALTERSGSDLPVSAVIGPCIGPCCYEVDEPVLRALRARFSGDLDAALAPSRSGHWMLDLARLVDRDLSRAGVPESSRGRIPDACTFCNPQRFHSYRRDGSRAGRLLHHVRARRSS